MVEYHDYGVKLSKGQITKIFQSHRKGIGLTIRLSKSHVNGDNKLPLTQTQLSKMLKATTGVQLNLSAAQIKHMEKSGGFLPLAALIPLIISGIGAASGIVTSAVSAAKSNAEQARHNRTVEEELKKSGSGLQKITLDNEDINKIKKGECVCCDGWKIQREGSGLYLEPEMGRGLFLERER